MFTDHRIIFQKKQLKLWVIPSVIFLLMWPEPINEHIISARNLLNIFHLNHVSRFTPSHFFVVPDWGYSTSASDMNVQNNTAK